MADDEDPEAAYNVALSRLVRRDGVEAVGRRLQESLLILRHQAKVQRIHTRIMTARLRINRAAVERLEVHDDEKADFLFQSPTPNYRGAEADNAWLLENAGYGVQEGQAQAVELQQESPAPMSEPTPPPPPAPPGPPQRRSKEARQEAAPMGEPDATAGMLLACLLDDPMRLDAHYETLAALPCGRWDALREVMLEQLGAVDTHPAVRELRAAKPRLVAYTAKGWEAAARSLTMRFPPAT